MPIPTMPEAGEAAARAAKATEELGVTGLITWNSPGGILQDEFLPELRGINGRRVYREMADNDPVIGGVLFIIEMLFRAVEWRVETPDDSPEAQDVADFVESCLEDMDHTWDDFVSEACSMLVFGWQVSEIVLKRRLGRGQKDKTRRSNFDDGMIGIRKLAPRGQNTLLRWHFDENGDLLGMVQTDPTKGDNYLPLDRCVHLKTTSRRASPEGRSILRTAYREWYFKKKIEEIEAIGIERDLAGLPIFRVPMQLLKPDAAPADKAMLQEIKSVMANVRQDKAAGILLPSDMWRDGQGSLSSTPMFEAELLSSGGSRQFPTDAVINRRNKLIAATVAADFILLGQEKVGSYALSKDKTSLFGTALDGWNKAKAGALNRGLIPQLMSLNGIDRDLWPRLTASSVLKPDLQSLGDYIGALAKAGMQLFPDLETEKVLRDAGGLPPPPEDGFPAPALPTGGGEEF